MFDVKIIGAIEIEASAFTDYKGLTAVEFPTSLTKIGDFAFQNCDQLKNANISALSNLVEIGASAFANCFKAVGSITSITIPASVTKIGATAFGNCTQLTNMTFAGASKPTFEIGQ
jgi:hypothetical protein